MRTIMLALALAVGCGSASSAPAAPPPPAVPAPAPAPPHAAQRGEAPAAAAAAQPSAAPQEVVIPPGARLIKNPVKEGLLAKDWIGFRIGARPPTFYDVGPIEIDDNPKYEPREPHPVDADPARRRTQVEDEVDEARTPSTIIDYERERQILMIPSPDADKIAAALREQNAAR